MQIFTAFLFFYVFGLAAIIMTWYVVRAIIKFMRAARVEQQQKDNADAHPL